jgi:hypothetical protein
MLAGLALLMSACDKMNDLHEEYIKDGEIFYLTNPDSIVFLPDNYSVLVKMWVYNAPNVKKIKIFWDNKTGSYELPVTFSNGKDSLMFNIPDLEEKNYDFTLYLEDNLGNRSIPISASCNVLGDIWISTISERGIDHVSSYYQRNIIYWVSAPENLHYSEVEYEDRVTGEIKVIQIPPTEMVTEITNAKPCVRIKNRSVYSIASGLMYGNWKLYSPVIRTLQIVGDPTGWAYGSGTYAADFDDANPYVFVFPRVHLSPTIWKFDWDYKWDWDITPMVERSDMVSGPISFWWYYDPGRANGDPYWQITPDTEGDYKLIVDLNAMWITIEKL